MDKSDARLGMQVQYSAVFRRVVDPALEGERKYWEPFEESGSGFLIGLRYLQNGVSVFLGPGDGHGWETTSVQLAAQVSSSLWRKPVLVPLENLRRTPTEIELAIQEFGRSVQEFGRSVSGRMAELRQWLDFMSAVGGKNEQSND